MVECSTKLHRHDKHRFLDELTNTKHAMNWLKHNTDQQSLHFHLAKLTVLLIQLTTLYLEAKK